MHFNLNKIWRMDGEPKDETGDTHETGTPEQGRKVPLSKLRDLRPEKDPIGAGRHRASGPSSNSFLR